MSGTAAPASVSLTQNVLGPSVMLVQGPAVTAPAPGPFPLASDPSQNWQLVNGVWTLFDNPAGEDEIGLAGDDVIGLEDDGGTLGTEP